MGAGGYGGRYGTQPAGGALSSVIQASATPTTRKTGGGGQAGQGTYDPGGLNVGGPGSSGMNFHPDYTTAGSGGGQAGGPVGSVATTYSQGGVGGNRTTYGATNVVPFAGNNGGHGGRGYGGSSNAVGAAGGSAVSPPGTGSSGSYATAGLAHSWTGSITRLGCGGGGLQFDGSSYGTSTNIDGNFASVTAGSSSAYGSSAAAGKVNTGGGGGGNYNATGATHNQGGSGTVWIRYKV